MTDQYIGEIRLFAGNFPPTGWALCNGQILSISLNTALFSILGTTYGGDGRTNFALPNLQGSAPLAAGQGAGLSLRSLGEAGGGPTVTLLASEMPAHTHAAQAFAGPGGATPTGSAWAEATDRGIVQYAPSVPADNVAMSPTALAPSGGNLPHNNLPPYLGLTFIIALQGIYPPRA